MGQSCPKTLPANYSNCATSESCYYEDCSGSGRTEARCSSGFWIVTSAACGAVKCISFDGAVSLTCPSGRVCLAPYGASPICAAYTCGTGPITTDCVAGASGSCNFAVSTSVREGITLSCCTTGGTSCWSLRA